MMRAYPRYSDTSTLRRPFLTVEVLFAAFSIMSFWISLSIPPLRHVTYLIPLCAFIGCLALRKFVVPQHLLGYWLLVCIGIMLAPLSGRNGYQDIYLMLIGISPFLLGFKYRFTWWQSFWVMFAGLIVATIVTRLLGVGGTEFTLDVVGSKSSFESPWCFAFGLLSVWAIATRRWKEALVGILFTLLTLKRIALLGVLLCLMLSLMPRRLADFLLRPVPMLLFNIAALAVAVTYAQGGLDRLIGDVMGMSANQAGMGRKELYYAPAVQLTEHLERYLVIGSGAGAVYDFLAVGYFYGRKLNLHNDLLKMVLEYGGLALVGFLWLAFHVRSWPLRLFWAYANVLLITDNTLIYPYYIFCFGMMAMTADAEVREHQQRPVPAPSRSPMRTPIQPGSF